MSARQPQRKPWFHAPSGFWCAQIHGKRHYLDRDPDVATRKLKKLLQDEKRGDACKQEWLDAFFSDLADEFLDDVKARKKPRTYGSYKEMLTLAQKHLGIHLRVGEVKKLHLTKLEGVLTRACSSTTVFKALHAVQRVFNWAVENDLLELSPLVGYKKPRPRERSRVIDFDEFQKMLRGSSRPFRSRRWTGCGAAGPTVPRSAGWGRAIAPTATSAGCRGSVRGARPERWSICTGGFRSAPSAIRRRSTSSSGASPYRTPRSPGKSARP